MAISPFTSLRMDFLTAMGLCQMSIASTFTATTLMSFSRVTLLFLLPQFTDTLFPLTTVSSQVISAVSLLTLLAYLQLN